MPTYTFERVTRPVTKTVPCRDCGKKLKRSTTLEQTISPFNKNGDGTAKTRDQIAAELREEAATWHPRNDICPTCDGVAEAGPAKR